MKAWMQFRLSWLFVVMLVVSILLAYGDIRLNYLVWRMRNSDISARGPNLVLHGAAKQIVEEYGVDARRVLRSKLDDPDRFAAAHVALGEATGVKTGATWHNNAGDFIYNRLAYSRDVEYRLTFRLVENTHLAEWWQETVGDHVGIPLIDEAIGEYCWLD